MVNVMPILWLKAARIQPYHYYNTNNSAIAFYILHNRSNQFEFGYENEKGTESEFAKEGTLSAKLQYFSIRLKWIWVIKEGAVKWKRRQKNMNNNNKNEHLAKWNPWNINLQEKKNGMKPFLVR